MSRSGNEPCDPEHHATDLPGLNTTERKRLVEEWCGGTSAHPRNKCIHKLFEEQAHNRPGATAIMFGGAYAPPLDFAHPHGA